jgi:hypothetical protein
MVSHSLGVAFFGSTGWNGNTGFSNEARITNLSCYLVQGCLTAGFGSAGTNLTGAEVSDCDASPSTGSCDYGGMGAVATPGAIIGFGTLHIDNIHGSGFLGTSDLEQSSGSLITFTGTNNTVTGGNIQGNTNDSETGLSMVSASRTIIKGLTLENYNLCFSADGSSTNNEADFGDNGTCSTLYSDSGTNNQWLRAGGDWVNGNGLSAFNQTVSAATTSAMSQQTSTTLTAITNMSWSITASKNYFLLCEIPVTFASSATIAFGLSGPGTPTSYNIDAYGLIGTSAVFGDINLTGQTSWAVKTGASGAPGAVTEIIHLNAVIQNGTSNGTLKLETAANGSNGITVGANAACTLARTN